MERLLDPRILEVTKALALEVGKASLVVSNEDLNEKYFNPPIVEFINFTDRFLAPPPPIIPPVPPMPPVGPVVTGTGNFPPPCEVNPETGEEIKEPSNCLNRESYKVLAPIYLGVLSLTALVYLGVLVELTIMEIKEKLNKH